MTCSLCKYESEFLPSWSYKGKKNDSWGDSGVFTVVVHCPKCGDFIVLTWKKVR